jgi:hypothetical protein
MRTGIRFLNVTMSLHWLTLAQQIGHDSKLDPENIVFLFSGNPCLNHAQKYMSISVIITHMGEGSWQIRSNVFWRLYSSVESFVTVKTYVIFSSKESKIRHNICSLLWNIKSSQTVNYLKQLETAASLGHINSKYVVLLRLTINERMFKPDFI